MGRDGGPALLDFDDFCAVVGDSDKADLIDGVLYRDGPESPATNLRFGRLLCLLNGFVEQRDLGEVFAVRIAWKLDERNVVEPDLAFIRTDRRHLCRRIFIDGPPDLAVEIVTEDTRDRDLRLKRSLYERHRIREYWLFDDDAARATCLRLDSRGRYRPAPSRAGVLHSEVVPGFWIPEGWLWQEPEPDLLDMLNDILANPRGPRS